jgi:hydroxymethylpyrimidine pyrophosphatase-like HAD family hydrolase
MKKAVFFDIDGTLWNYKMQIPQSTVSAIRKLRENGHYAFICSGRSRSNIQSPDLLGIGFDGVVASCGRILIFIRRQSISFCSQKRR